MSEVFQLWRINKDKFPRINLEEGNDEEKTSYVPAISGAFMLISRKRYEEIGGMDEGYFFHVEDLDFCKEIEIQGGKIIYIPSIKSTHFRSSSDVTTFFVEKYKTKGFLRYFRKHYSKYYLGGFVLLMTVAIGGRFIIRAPKILMREMIAKKKNKSNKLKELA
jgi:GT2 family glycosyltransferase